MYLKRFIYKIEAHIFNIHDSGKLTIWRNLDWCMKVGNFIFYLKKLSLMHERCGGKVCALHLNRPIKINWIESSPVKTTGEFHFPCELFDRNPILPKIRHYSFCSMKWTDHLYKRNSDQNSLTIRRIINV